MIINYKSNSGQRDIHSATDTKLIENNFNI